jgi:hypothetical protein
VLLHDCNKNNAWKKFKMRDTKLGSASDAGFFVIVDSSLLTTSSQQLIDTDIDVPKTHHTQCSGTQIKYCGNGQKEVHPSWDLGLSLRFQRRTILFGQQRVVFRQQ